MVDLDVWYFDSGDTKHVTSQCNFFTSLLSTPIGNTISCANNSSYPIKGVGHIVLIVVDGNTLTLLDALYVPRIKKNLLSISTLTKIGLVMKFIDEFMISLMVIPLLHLVCYVKGFTSLIAMEVV